MVYPVINLTCAEQPGPERSREKQNTGFGHSTWLFSGQCGPGQLLFFRAKNQKRPYL